MTTTTTHDEPVLAHADSCPEPRLVLRSSWKGLPEVWCPSCGRYAAVPVLDGLED